MASLDKEYTSKLLAVIYVKNEMVALGSQERVAVAEMCNKAVTQKTERDTKYIESIKDCSMGVQIVVSPGAIQVHCEEYLVSHFKMDDISVLMSFPKSEANFVIVGQCSKKRKPMALVFDLLSDQQAEECIQAIAKAAVKGHDFSSLQKTYQPYLPKPSILKPTLIRTVYSPSLGALISGQDAQPKPQFHSGRNLSEPIGASSDSSHQGQWPHSRRFSLAESMSSLNLKNSVSSQLAAMPSTPHVETPKRFPLAMLEASRVEKRPSPVLLPIQGKVAHRSPLPTPITPQVSPPRKTIYQKPLERNVPHAFNIPVPSPCPRSDHLVNKPLKLPKPEFISKNQQELLATRAQILKSQSTQSVLNKYTENIDENIDSTEGSLFKPPSDSSPTTVSSVGAVNLNPTPREIPNEAFIYKYPPTTALKRCPVIPFAINHTQIQEQSVKIPTRTPSWNVGTDKIQDVSNPKNVKEKIKIFNGIALKNPTLGQHSYDPLKDPPSLNALNKMPELDKAAYRHLSDQHIPPSAISATDDSHQSNNSSEFSVNLNEEQINAEPGSPYCLETVINKFLMNEYAYIETLDRICKARKSVPPELQNLLRGVESLYEIHVSMYNDLYASRESCSKIAGVFISYRDKLEFYKYYMLNSPDISIHMVDLPDTVRANHPFLADDVKTIWKRLHYYCMNLENMISLSKEEERSLVSTSIDLMKHLNTAADSGILLDCIKDTPYNLHLKAPLLLHSSFKITGPGLRCSIFYALLFSELIVITTQKENHYVYEMDIYIQQTNCIDTKQDNKFLLEVDRGRNKLMTYTFKTTGGGVRNAWVEEIRKLKYTIAEKEKTERYKRFGI